MRWRNSPEPRRKGVRRNQWKRRKEDARCEGKRGSEGGLCSAFLCHGLLVGFLARCGFSVFSKNRLLWVSSLSIELRRESMQG